MGSSWRRGILLRLFLLGAGAAGFGLLLAETRYYLVSVLAGGVLLLLVFDFLRLSRSADRDLVRVIDAIGYGDLADWPLSVGRQNLDQPIAQAFARALDRLRRRSAVAEGERARLLAVVEHAPVPLLALESDGRIELLNRAARRLFDGVAVTRRAELIALAPDFDLMLAAPVVRQLVRLTLPRGPQRCLVSVAGSVSAERNSAILSLQNIEGELEASELRAWEELVRVLAHEIMNSLTPVASLAQTAGLLVEDLRAATEPATTLAELDEAVDAIHRRSAGLMRFVESYRRFAEPPFPVTCAIPVAVLFDRAQRLHGASLAACGVVLDIEIEPPTLIVQADPDLLDQALVNLIKNAIEAVAHSAEKRIALTAGLDERGHVVLTIADTGPGLSPPFAEQIFVPFFTTKAKGSGIGLPIVRQIMRAHGGTIEAVSGPGGARFRLRF
jgi:two-component system, NtrC family, nitrogen regulation sensor histidine kinase NtrY